VKRHLIECVPNFSEGRRPEVIEAIVAPFRGKKGCYLLDHRADPDHNRLVVSLVGQAEPIQEALLAASLAAVERIDLNAHQGAHPRIGAIDVIPFIPLRNITMEECVQLARDFGRRFQQTTGVPVYFYDKAAINPNRTALEVIRKGQYEALRTEVAKPERRPDVGEPRLHPTAGATIIGARKFLIAFNVNLATDNLQVAKQIARAIRSSNGGLSSVKGIGIALEGRGMVQVSMNVVDYEKNPLYRIVEFIRMEARRWGVSIAETEVYGMVPAGALLDSVSYYMQSSALDSGQVIELAILDQLGGEEDE
jgi:glutamate formiminotransferase / 5-formyltetrahydrofolate cyclo-ligase